MKVVIYFGLIIISFVFSIYVGSVYFRKNNTIFLAFVIAYLPTVLILGLGSIWWFLTETDGISQGLGVTIFVIAAGVIGVVDLILLSFLKGKSLNGK
ncbi:hypothetical protein [Ornithinibacillus californiensis]|uniref:hypothetical protein n=1 Tax=Ornithinibacillus californiensis TaxID=161536 RepID=UPI00064D940A|nr:hypothetical protein [Ornithinibacillus californiensis]